MNQPPDPATSSSASTRPPATSESATASRAPGRPPARPEGDNKRLWIRWTLLVAFVAALGTAFVYLGEWQLERLEQRRQRNISTIANTQNEVLPWEQVLTRTITDADQWQRVSAVGIFDAERQVLLRYRTSGDLNGYEVLTPLRTTAGTVLVDRGIVPLSAGEEVPSTAPPPPTGTVTVVGHVRRNEVGRSSARVPVNGAARLIDSNAVGATLPYPVANGYIGLLTVEPGQTGNFKPVALPEISDGPHFWYAAQWFMFTGIGVLGIVVFIRADLRERRTGARSSPRVTRESRSD